jgi:hypothetical protein
MKVVMGRLMFQTQDYGIGSTEEKETAGALKITPDATRVLVDGRHATGFLPVVVSGHRPYLLLAAPRA